MEMMFRSINPYHSGHFLCSTPCSNRYLIIFQASQKQADLDISWITFYLIETPFNAFANRADPDQAALYKSCLISVYSVYLLEYD